MVSSTCTDLGDVVVVILSQRCPPHSERAQVKQHEWASEISSRTKVGWSWPTSQAIPTCDYHLHCGLLGCLQFCTAKLWNSITRGGNDLKKCNWNSIMLLHAVKALTWCTSAEGSSGTAGEWARGGCWCVDCPPSDTCVRVLFTSLVPLPSYGMCVATICTHSHHPQAIRTLPRCILVLLC